MVVDSCPKGDNLIVSGDFNATTGNDRDGYESAMEEAFYTQLHMIVDCDGDRRRRDDNTELVLLGANTTINNDILIRARLFGQTIWHWFGQE